MKAREPRLPKSCIRSGCSADVMATCAVCGGPLIRIKHNRERHNAEDLKTGALPSGSSETWDRQCVGEPHEYREAA